MQHKKNIAKKAKKCEAPVRTIGGERVSLTTTDNVKLDGVYLDASNFKRKLADSGCQMTTLKTKNASLNAIFISYDDYQQSGKQVFDALHALRTFADPEYSDEPGAGWQLIQHKDGVLIVNDSEISGHPLLQFNHEEEEWVIKEEVYQDLTIEKSNIDTKTPPSGTAIITSGNAGVYEMHKNEAVFYLLHNMNVLLFNFRGYGESEGSPTLGGMKLDIESAYQFAKMRSNHEDKKILFKSLCMSGAFAAYMSAKHPKTNIILDQSFSNFRKVLDKQVDEEFQNYKTAAKYIPQFLKKVVIGLISSLTIDVNVAKALAKNEGKQGIVYADEDELMDIQNTDENMRAIFKKAGKVGNLTVMKIPGEHGTSVTRATDSTLSKFSQEEQDEFQALKTQKQELKQKKTELDEKEIELDEKIESGLRCKTKLENTLLRAGITDFDTNVKYKNFIKKFNTKQQELSSIQKELSSIQDQLDLIYTKSKKYKSTEAIGQNQIKHFLAKAGLGTSLIPSASKTDLRMGIRSANELINGIEKLRNGEANKLVQRFEILFGRRIDQIQKQGEIYRIQTRKEKSDIEQIILLEEDPANLLDIEEEVNHLLSLFNKSVAQGLIVEKDFANEKRLLTNLSNLIARVKRKLPE